MTLFVSLLGALLALLSNYGSNQFPEVRILPNRRGTLIRATLWAFLGGALLPTFISNDADAKTKQIAGLIGAGLLVALLYEMSSAVSAHLAGAIWAGE